MKTCPAYKNYQLFQLNTPAPLFDLEVVLELMLFQSEIFCIICCYVRLCAIE
jgi:hypothetical protein